MKQRVEVVDCRIEIELANSTIINLKMDKFGELINLDNYITGLSVIEELSTSTTNPVGVVSSNILKLELKSVNKELVAENRTSPYYGYLNNTAIIKVFITESDEEIPFGTWYVDSWYSNITNVNPYKVTIIAYDLFSSVGKSVVPRVRVNGNINVKQFFISTIDAYNSTAETKRRINYDASEIGFTEFPIIKYSNLDITSMSNCFNTLSQATLTNIMWSRDNRIVTDYCGDSSGESVCTLHDGVNITSAGEVTGALVNYNGVKVNYSLGIVNKTAKLTELENQTVILGSNRFDNISIGESVYKVNYVCVKTSDDVKVEVDYVEYNKDSINVILESEGETNCSILVYGQTINNSKLFVEKYKTTMNKTVLEINNNVIIESDVNKYADGVLNLLDLNNSLITIKGWFNPRIKLGNIVDINIVESTGIPVGFYKVVGLEWIFNSTVTCSMKLMKVVE